MEEISKKLRDLEGGMPKEEKPVKQEKSSAKKDAGVLAFKGWSAEQLLEYDKISKKMEAFYDKAWDLNKKPRPDSLHALLAFIMIRETRVNPVPAVQGYLSKVWDAASRGGIDLSVRGAMGNYNWCGPKTDVWNNLMKGLGPTNTLDRACMIHDISYITAATEKNSSDVSKAVDRADARLLKRAREISADKSIDSSIRRSAGIVDFVVTNGRSTGANEAFVEKDVKVISGDNLKKMDARALQLMKSLSRKAVEQGLGDSLEPDLKEIEKMMEETMSDDPIEVPEEKKQEESPKEESPKEEAPKEEAPAPAPAPETGAPTPAAPATETTSVLPEGFKTAPPLPKPRLDVEGRPKMNPVPSATVVGERSLRPMITRQEGDTIAPTAKQRKQNMLWLDQFSWVESGFGNGNQQRIMGMPSDGRTDNSIFEAQLKNDMVRYSGGMFKGNQLINPEIEISQRTHNQYRQPMTRVDQNHQQFVRNGSEPAGLGRPIQMFRRTQDTPLDWRNSMNTRLIHPNVVDGKRV